MRTRRRRPSSKNANTKAGYVILGALVALGLVLYVQCRAQNRLEDAGYTRPNPPSQDNGSAGRPSEEGERQPVQP